MTYHHVSRLLTTTLLLSSSAVVALTAAPGSVAQAAATCAPANAFAARTLTAPTPEAAAYFGFPTITADFNNDGYTDAAVGAGGGAAGGAVHVYYGSSTGLSYARALSQAPATPRVNDDFGTALAAGDFNGDGFQDLAVGAPGYRSDAGYVLWWRGSASGLTGNGTAITQEFTGEITEAGDRYGSALAAGDFNGDGKDDLAIGADEEVPSDATVRSGLVSVAQGSATGPARGWIIRQTPLGQTPKAGDEFGISLTVAHLVGDSREDLVVGARGKDIVKADTGGIFILDGAGNKTTSNPIIRGQGGTADETGDQFGSSTAIGDFNRDGTPDLAVGIPGESYTATSRRGMVQVFLGPVTKDSAGYFISPNDAGEGSGTNNRFGASVLAADVDRDAFTDLLVGAIGTPRAGLANAGSAMLFSGTRSGVVRAERVIFQGDVGGTDGANDYFGITPSVGDFNKDGRTDALIAAHGDTRNGLAGAGAVYLLDGLNPATARPVQQYAPTEALQTPPVNRQIGPIRYAYVDNVGGPRLITQPDPALMSEVYRVADGPADAVLTGRPAIGQTLEGKGVVAIRSTTGDLWIRTELGTETTAWGPWVNHGGPDLGGVAMASLPNGRLVIFGIGARGELTILPEMSTGTFGAWHSTGVGNLTGDPVTVPGPDGVRIFAADGDGNLQTALYSGVALTGCVTVGADRTIAGRPAVVVYPGSRLRVFATTADQQMITIGQDTAGVFEPAWTTVVTSGVAGSPAAIFSRTSARVTVMARGTDDQIWRTTETAQGSNQYDEWSHVFPDNPIITSTDVTAVPYTANGGDDAWVVYRDADNRDHLIDVNDTAQAAARGVSPSFSRRTLSKS
ncbi:MAG TPA: FG-GAP-like repeat-containing protein [Actinoplanes sp.]|nr:FG-GAP-like repeat-containing protein [Actinoplanes sp.]